MFPIESARERTQFLMDHLKDPILSSVRDEKTCSISGADPHS